MVMGIILGNRSLLISRDYGWQKA